MFFGYLTQVCCLFGNTTSLPVCEKNGPIVKCSGYIPLNVPKGISAVYLSKFSEGDSITNLTFAGPGWRSIDYLYISNKKVKDANLKLELGTKCFSGLTNLTYLGLNLDSIVFQSDVFHGLQNLRTLELSNLVVNSEEFLEKFLLSQYLINLKTLIFSNVDIQTNYGLNLDELFWSFVCRRQLEELKLFRMIINNFDLSSFYDNCYNLVNFGAISTHIKTAHVHLNHYSKSNVKIEHVELTAENLKLWYPEHSVKDVTFSLNQFGNMFQSAHTWRIENRCNVRKMSLPMDHLNLTDGFQFDSQTGWNLSVLSLRYSGIEILEN